MPEMEAKSGRGSTFGILSLCGVPVAAVAFLGCIGHGSEAGAWAAIGLCWVCLFGSFVCAAVGLARREKPLRPAVVGGLLSFVPAVLFVMGALGSLRYHFWGH